jgi:hypothetical protein
MRRTVEVRPMVGDGSIEGINLVSKKSYRVVVSEGEKRIVVESRLGLGALETLLDSEKYVEEFFKAGPLPQGTVIDIPAP